MASFLTEVFQQENVQIRWHLEVLWPCNIMRLSSEDEKKLIMGSMMLLGSSFLWSQRCLNTNSYYCFSSTFVLPSFEKQFVFFSFSYFNLYCSEFFPFFSHFNITICSSILHGCFLCSFSPVLITLYWFLFLLSTLPFCLSLSIFCCILSYCPMYSITSSTVSLAFVPPPAQSNSYTWNIYCWIKPFLPWLLPVDSLLPNA